MSDKPEPFALSPELLRRAIDVIASQPMQPHARLLSPRCGLHDQHAVCRSAICECDCHGGQA